MKFPAKYLRVKAPSDKRLERSMPRLSLIARLQICRVAKTQNTPVFVSEITEKCSVELQRVIAVILKILLLKGELWIVVSKENGLTRL